MSTPPNPNYSDLDPHQIFQRSFDESIDRLRVDAVASIDPGSMEVVISDTDDSIAIGDGAGNLVGVTGNALDVNIKSGIVLEVNLDEANDSVAVFGNDGTTNRALKTDSSGELQIDVLSSALPAGAATSNNQTNKAQYTRITDGIDDALVTASGELNVLATAQPGIDIGDVTINNASGASAVNIQDGGNSITIDGTVSAVQSGNWSTRTLDGAGNLIDSGVVGVGLIRALNSNIIQIPDNKYAASLNIRQTANTAATQTIFSMRNSTISTKDVVIEKLFLVLQSDGANNASTPRYGVVRFSGATPTGGTSLTISKMDTSSGSTNITDARFLDTGLTVTGVTFESGYFYTLGISANNHPGSFMTFDTPIKLAAGEGLAIQIVSTTRTGVTVTGGIYWSEV